jgi:hypothetical protein
MVLKLNLYGLLVGYVMISLTGCANVEPWDRNILAKDSMTIIPDQLGAEFKDHTEFSREGTQGGTGAGGGGCGCN